MKYCTMIKIDRGELDEVERLAAQLNKLDATFQFNITENHFIIYSGSENQAKSRGVWLTNKTKILNGKDYSVALNAPKPTIKAARSIQDIESEVKKDD